MTIRDIVLWPDARLTETCAPVDTLDETVQTLAQDMLDTMYHAQGRGLAAPQIGVMQRLFVMDINYKEGRSDPIICINPMLQEVGEDRATGPEACLSIPGVSMQVNRPATVQLVWTSLAGARVVQGFSGFGAVCVQHELDHLDGVVIFDHQPADTRETLLAQYAGASA